jgi:hypothetical protein
MNILWSRGGCRNGKPRSHRRIRLLRAYWVVVRMSDGQRKSVPVFIRRSYVAAAKIEVRP